MRCFEKRECWHMTWRLKIPLGLVLLFVVYFLMLHTYTFLSPQKPVKAKVLVVEGWLNDYALKECLQIFNNDSYDYLLITGGPLNTGYIITNYKSTAQVAKETLFRLGVPRDKVIAISRKLVWRERTYNSALALRDYLQKEMPNIESFNLVSLGAHSHRSWLLFQKAMPNIEIGIITIDEKRYDPEHWWRSSKGFRSVFTEAIGYVYVRLFF